MISPTWFHPNKPQKGKNVTKHNKIGTKRHTNTYYTGNKACKVRQGCKKLDISIQAYKHGSKDENIDISMKHLNMASQEMDLRKRTHKSM